MKVTAKLSTKLFNSDAIRDAFVNGWVDAGGTTSDSKSDAPWCRPWRWADAIRVEWDVDEPTPAGFTVEEAAAYQLGAAYWAAVGAEVLALIEEEQAYCA
ncbi:hypothetical protein [Gemmiger formicilis]|uniref:hypothetical protein n=1 Tax=Gemmiger formicilis TaxID=745368 RepID=UPI003AEFFF39